MIFFRKTPALAALLLASLLLAPRQRADAAAVPKTVRLLTIGNSFSGNATHFLGDIAKAAGNTLVHQPMSIGGASMEVHWTKIQANEKDPQDAAGLYGTRSLSQTLQSGDWDYVTIQQASIKSHDVETYRPFAAQLQEYVKKHAPKAELLIHQTWAYRSDDPRFAPKTPKVEPSSREAMYAALSSAYLTIAKELGVRRIPVGDAFNIADSDPERGFKPDEKFDKASAVPPALPDQTHSLHVGYHWAKSKDGKQTLAMDGHHANAAGEYLGACVFYEVLFKESIVGNSFLPPSLKPEDAKVLQDIAHRAVAAATK
ncbi:MAG TPA: DUF4886 domain-containing protein [Planctomycetota bacterium]|nr:DUF4886 domain-containing protein [Planctomycetota bacterium]